MSRAGARAALQGVVGNQAIKCAVDEEPAPGGSGGSDSRVRAPVEGETTACGPETVQRSPADGLCTRCARRFRAGTPLECADCEQALEGSADHHSQRSEADTVVQASLTVAAQDDRTEREAERVAEAVLQRSAGTPEGNGPPVAETGGAVTADMQVSGAFEREVESLRGTGRPLSAGTRSFFEPRFGTALGDVRVHTGEKADDLARSIDAEAFTVGRDVVFRRGAFRPETTPGKRLLAHELTHVVQQRGARDGATRRIQRTVSEGNISCANYPRDYPIFDVIGTEQPVETIREAERNAIRLLDRSIQTINAAVHQVRAQPGDPSVPGTIPEFLGDAVRHNFQIDPERRDVWTEGGMRTMPIVRQRLEAVKERLEADTVQYICLSGDCDPDATAFARKPHGAPVQNVIYLCEPWWVNLSKGEKASTVAHEVLHIYYWSFLKHVGEFGDAEHYEQFIEDVWQRRTRP